jgi:hypothetical protein
MGVVKTLTMKKDFDEIIKRLRRATSIPLRHQFIFEKVDINGNIRGSWRHLQWKGNSPQKTAPFVASKIDKTVFVEILNFVRSSNTMPIPHHRLFPFP